jgi:hypothetical protein
LNAYVGRYTPRMLGTRGLALVLVLTSTLLTGCGDDPPDREMQQAQSAIDAARSAGAGDYAHDEITAAEQALTKARQAVTERDYRLALTNALDSRERAQTAAKEASDAKAIAHTDTERALRDAADAIAQSKASLKIADAGRGTRRPLLAPRRAIDTADQALQEARTAFDQGDYTSAKKSIDAANARLAAANVDLDPPAPARPHRLR